MASPNLNAIILKITFVNRRNPYRIANFKFILNRPTLISFLRNKVE